MIDDAKRAEELWGPEIVGRRKDEPEEITELWRHTRNQNPWARGNTAKHWDGKPKKESS
jgi:hypothetical protein